MKLKLRRILLAAAALGATHFALLQVLARMNLLEHLLAPGAGSLGALAVTAVFLLLRIFLFVAAPGLIAVRLWLWATRFDRPAASASSTTGESQSLR